MVLLELDAIERKFSSQTSKPTAELKEVGERRSYLLLKEIHPCPDCILLEVTFWGGGAHTGHAEITHLNLLQSWLPKTFHVCMIVNISKIGLYEFM